MKHLLLTLVLLSMTASWARAAFISSTQSGPWSAPSTWGGAPPQAGDSVTISAGTTVTLDITTATSTGDLVINGTLSFDPAVSTRLSMSGGNVLINSGGRLEMGTSGTPIPNGITAELVLALGPGPYGLIVNPGGAFISHGFAKTPWVEATGDALVGATSIDVPAAQIADWDIGDLITIGATEKSVSTTQTEERTIAGISGNTVSWSVSEGLQYSHYAISTIRVANLTRNVVVRSSSTSPTSTSTNGSYFNSRATSAADFRAVHTEFAFLGRTTGGVNTAGVSLTGAGTVGNISSCTVRNGYVGIYSASTDPQTVLSDNLIYKSAQDAVRLDGSFTTVRGNDLYASVQKGANVRTGSQNCLLEGNHIYSNQNGDWYVTGAGHRVLDNRATCNRVSGGGVNGVFNVDRAQNILVQGNVIGRNVSRGIYSTGTVNSVFRDNEVYETFNGIYLVTSHRNLLEDNEVHDQSGAPAQIYLLESNDNVLSGNEVRTSSSGGYPCLWIANSARNLLVGGDFHSSSTGIQVTGAGSTGNVFLRNAAYDLSNSYLEHIDSIGNLHVEDRLGYDHLGNSYPGNFSTTFVGSGAYDIIMKNPWINPDPTISMFSSGMFSAQNQSVTLHNVHAPAPTLGTTRVYGDRVLSEATVLDYAAPLCASSATTPVLLWGTGHTASVVSTSDDNAVTQLVTLEFDGSLWQVTGSVTSSLGNFSAGGVTGGLFPSTPGTEQFVLNFTPGGVPQTGDRVAFGLMAASGDKNVQKRLLFGNGDSSFRSGKSQLTVTPGAGLTLKGDPTFPTLMERLSGTGNYFLFVGSGSLVMENAQVTGMDAGGLRLTGSGGVLMSSVTFDNIEAGGTSYLTAQDLVSNATFTRVTFNDTPNRQPFNVNVQGSDSGLRWFFASLGGGARWGDGKDNNDPNQKVLWADTLGPQPPPFSASPGTNTGEVDLSWTATLDREDVDPGTTTSLMKGGHFRVFRSTDSIERDNAQPSQAQIIFPATTTSAGTDWGVTDVVPLLQTHYYKLWAVDELGNVTAMTDAATPLRTTPGQALNFSAQLQGTADVLLSWNHPANPTGAYRGDYLLEFSSTSSAGPWTAVPGTVLATDTGYLHAGLPSNKTFYYQLTTRDNGLPPFSSSPAGPVSAITADTSVPQVSVFSVGPATLGVALSAGVTLNFSKPMDAASVLGAVTLTRVKDNMGNVLNSTAAVAISSSPAGDQYTIAFPALEGNNTYEVTVATTAGDNLGNLIALPRTVRFTTVMNRSQPNVVTEGVNGSAVEIPAYALGANGYLEAAPALPPAAQAATTKLSSNNGDNFRNPVPGGWVDLEVLDENGAPQAPFAAPVTLRLAYLDDDNNGVVDNTFPPVRVSSLRVHRLDKSGAFWQPLPGSTVDPVAKTVSVLVPHLSVYALIGAPGTDVSAARAFPNPFIAGKSGASDITFLGLGQVSTVKIFTTDGLLVRELRTDDGSGRVDWDVKDAGGEPVSAGLYLYRVTSGDESRTGKLAVVK